MFMILFLLFDELREKMKLYDSFKPVSILTHLSEHYVTLKRNKRDKRLSNIENLDCNPSNLRNSFLNFRSLKINMSVKKTQRSIL